MYGNLDGKVKIEHYRIWMLYLCITYVIPMRYLRKIEHLLKEKKRRWRFFSFSLHKYKRAVSILIHCRFYRYDGYKAVR